MSGVTPVTPAALSAMLNGDIKNAMVALSPGGIERQEAEGQQELVSTSLFPKESDWKSLNKLGFKVVSEADDIFFNVTMPNGWTKVSTDHSMWSNILDEKGRIRLNVFYKAAFYDRSSFSTLIKRYSVCIKFVDDLVKIYVGDNETVLFDIEKCVKMYSEEYNLLSKKASNWLDENYPDHNDPTAYWD